MQIIDRIVAALDQAALQTDDRRKLLIVGSEEQIERLRTLPGARSLWGNLPDCFAGRASIRGSFAGVPVAAVGRLAVVGDGLTFMLGDQVVGAVPLSERMTPAQFQAIGQALYGDNWKGAYQANLGIDDRTIRRIQIGEREIPDGVRRDIVEALDLRIRALQSLRAQV